MSRSLLYDADMLLMHSEGQMTTSRLFRGARASSSLHGEYSSSLLLSPRQDKGKGRAPRTPSPEPVDPECIAPIMSEDEDVRGEEVDGGGHVDVSASVAHTRIPLHLSYSF